VKTHRRSPAGFEVDLGLVRIRSWRSRDAESLARHASNRKVWINMRDRFPHPYSRADAEAFLESVIGSDPETHFAIEHAGEAAGGVGYVLGTDVHRRSAELGFWLAEGLWGKGIMTAVVKAMVPRIFALHDLVRIHAYVFDWNPASMHVLEKCGFTSEGRLRLSVTKDGRTIDQVLYATFRDSSPG